MTIVKEVSKTLLVKQSPVQIIKQTQLFHNFQPVKPKRISKVHDMLALTIAPYLSIGLCPTTSHVWILEAHIKSVEKTMDGRLLIYFTNEKGITLYPKKKESDEAVCAMDDQPKEKDTYNESSYDQAFLKEVPKIQYTIRFKGRRNK